MLQSLGSQRLRHDLVIQQQPYISPLSFRLPFHSSLHSALNRVLSAVYRHQYCLCVSFNLPIPSTTTHFLLGMHIFHRYVKVSLPTSATQIRSLIQVFQTPSISVKILYLFSLFQNTSFYMTYFQSTYMSANDQISFLFGMSKSVAYMYPATSIK